MGKVKIAFDLDGIIIDKPPFVSKKLLERLFRGNKQNGLHYRFPTTKLEKGIRKISHFYLFRPPIKGNIAFVKKIAREKRYELYIVSGRYSFLRKETENWLKKMELIGLFKKVFLNLTDEQPHLFKERILRELKPDVFVDDDNLIADYLAEKINDSKIYCLSAGSSPQKALKLKSLENLV